MTKRAAFILATVLAASCGGDDGGDGEEDPNLDPNAAYLVSGRVIDFETGEPLEGPITIVTDGIRDAPVTTEGSTFYFTAPANSTFHVLAGSPPDYVGTYNTAIEVGVGNLVDIDLYAVRADYFDGLAADFGVTVEGARGALIMRAVSEDGAPVAGVPAAAFDAPEGASGPYFLDAALAADPALTSTSESGLAMFFEVEPGLQTIESLPEAETAILAPSAPVIGDAVSYLEALVVEGGIQAIERPENVSFSQDIAPLFLSRGCVACHEGGGIGKDLGGLHLNGADNKMYRELTEELSPNYDIVRVNLEAPEESLMLTMPSAEDPPDNHPFSTFAGAGDPDYLTILVWIEEGALQN